MVRKIMISIIIPVHNVGNFLHICLNSILKQNFSDFEVICVDDASTDSSLEILEYFAKKDSRIKILKNDSNYGPGYSRNRGLDIAQGKYILFIDADDWLSQNVLQILVRKSDKDNLDLLMFKGIVYYEDKHNFGMAKYYDMEFMNKFVNKVFNHCDIDKTKLFSLPNAPWNKLYLKSFLDEKNIRFPDENLIHEDNPFFYNVFTSARRISLLNKYCYNRRRWNGSLTTLTNERVFDNIDMMYKVLDVFIENELYDYYKKEILTYIFVNVLHLKYNRISGEFKEEFYKKVQESFKVYIQKYGLYKDIKDNVDKETLDFFKFDEIVSEILSS